MTTAIENAHALYMEGIRDGHPREALAKYVGARYTQHSTGVADGPEGFLEFFEPFLKRNPKREIRIVRSFQDGYYVFVQAYQSLNDGQARWVTMDIFDSDEHGRIVEHWDVIVPFIEGAVDGETKIVDLDKTEANKETVRAFLRDERRPWSFVDHASSRGELRYDYRFKVLGSGNFVASLCRGVIDGKAYAVVDLFRLEADRIVEHWGAHEEILPRDQWNNAGKF